jgi:WASH complex subunit 7
VLGAELRNEEKHPHLTHFYIILPPLILNFIEHMITSKDKLRKTAHLAQRSRSSRSGKPQV